MRPTLSKLRGKVVLEPWMGLSCYPVTPSMVGGEPRVRPGYTHFKHMQAQPPVRCIGVDVNLPLVLYNRMDQIVQIEKMLALQRVENQISVTLSQLSFGIRNVDNFIANHLMNKEVRPSMYTLWFHEDGLREHQHILSNLAAHHLVPLFSLLSYDVERGKMTSLQAEELYEELMDCSVAQPAVVQRELAHQMIRVYCLEDDYDKAIGIIDEMKAKGIRRTFVSYAPLFRMIRSKEDTKEQIKLLMHMYEVEGGRLCKCLVIDVPRMLYLFGVFLRYNWAFINVTCTCLGTTLVLFWHGFGHIE